MAFSQLHSFSDISFLPTQNGARVRDRVVMDKLYLYPLSVCLQLFMYFKIPGTM